MNWRTEVIGTVPFLPYLKKGDFWHDKLNQIFEKELGLIQESSFLSVWRNFWQKAILLAQRLTRRLMTF
jgi:hypothetical protein